MTIHDIRRQIPNILTLLNLLSGCIGLYALFQYQYDWIPWCVGISLLADFLDGLAARALNAHTSIGKDLDSLADVVSFGVLPGAMLFQLLLQAGRTANNSDIVNLWMSVPGFSVTLFAALRLAKFNHDQRQTDSFIGLATPAMTIFVVGILLMILHNSLGLSDLLLQRPVLWGIAAVLSVLQLAEIPMFSLKFKDKRPTGRIIPAVFLAIVLLLLITIRFAALPAGIILYVATSIILNRLNETS